MNLGKLITKYYAATNSMCDSESSDNVLDQIKEHIEKMPISLRNIYLEELDNNSSIDKVPIYHTGLNIFHRSLTSTDGKLGPAPRAVFYNAKLDESLLTEMLLNSEFSTADRNRLFALYRLCGIDAKSRELVEITGANFNAISKKLRNFKEQIITNREYRISLKAIISHGEDLPNKNQLLGKLDELNSR